ncbi:unnamed protein product [Somion occarium]|uniref:Uncharacterized protein n=1 Tax=Somion occarium TaxID=3059160 RepID=A0ABP1E2T0_9APHY
MGRPLFSSKLTQDPVIHVEPELTPHPTYDTWNVNAFDPDSDEFFNSDDAVYEAFVDPAQLPQIDVGVGPVIPPELSDDSSSSSESESGRDTPVDVTDNRYTRLGLEVQRAERMRNTRPSHYPNTLRAPRMVRESSETNAFGRTTLVFHSRLRVPPDNLEDSSVEIDTSAPIPIIPPRTSPAPHPIIDDAPLTTPPLVVPGRPSTPPTQSNLFYSTSSSAPSVTPRLYTWNARRNIYSSTPGPLPNRGARMSVAHITPVVSHVVG